MACIGTVLLHLLSNSPVKNEETHSTSQPDPGSRRIPPESKYRILLSNSQFT
jgi:hypothetical protein